jgi:hypothetical protein
LTPAATVVVFAIKFVAVDPAQSEFQDVNVVE